MKTSFIQIKRNEFTRITYKSNIQEICFLGPAKARELFDAGITNLKELKNHEAKLNHAQKIGLKYFEDFELRIPRAEIAKLLDEMDKTIKGLDEDYVVTVCGSYR